AAKQGVVWLLAYLWILVAFVRAFWKGRRLAGAVALFGGWDGYQVSMQVDFSYIPTAVLFWLFAAAAIVTWAPDVKPVRRVAFPRRVAVPALAVGSLALAALAIPDEHLGDHAAALAAARHALSLDRYDKDSQALVQRLESQ